MPLAPWSDDSAFIPPLQLPRRDSSQRDHVVRTELGCVLLLHLASLLFETKETGNVLNILGGIAPKSTNLSSFRVLTRGIRAEDCVDGVGRTPLRICTFRPLRITIRGSKTSFSGPFKIHDSTTAHFSICVATPVCDHVDLLPAKRAKAQTGCHAKCFILQRCDERRQRWRQGQRRKERRRPAVSWHEVPQHRPLPRRPLA